MGRSREETMGLGLTFKVGEDFYANDERFTIARIVDRTSFVVRRQKDGVEFVICESGSREIWPHVFASANPGRGKKYLARIDLDGPETIIFATGENYRKARGLKFKPGRAGRLPSIRLFR
jgi:hypothetical protein